jgi:hypothetical protein
MAEIVDFIEEKEKRSEHATGPTLCLYCKHEWVSVAPIGIDHLQCPRCRKFAGIFKYLFKPDCERYVCSCDNDFFYVLKTGLYCPKCGIHHGFDTL